MTTLNIPRALVDHMLDLWPVARLATVTEHGKPHAVPVVFTRLTDHLYVPVDGKQKRHAKLQRLRNIAANPHASLLLDHYDDDWQQLWWVRIDGEADRVQPEDEFSGVLLKKLRSKYPQYQTTPITDKNLTERATFLRINIQRINGWAQSRSTSSIQKSLETLTHPSESD